MPTPARTSEQLNGTDDQTPELAAGAATVAATVKASGDDMRRQPLVRKHGPGLSRRSCCCGRPRATSGGGAGGVVTATRRSEVIW
jgi:hypothetical protein